MADSNRLEAALADVIADPTSQAVFEHALLAETVYVSPSDGPLSEDQTLGIDRPFRLDGVTLKDGQTPTALFTSVGRLKAAFGTDAPAMGMRGLHALELMKANGVALNPGAPPGLVLSSAEVEAILVDVRDAAPSATADAMILSMPDREPTNLVSRLREAVSLPQVSGAWLARAAWSDGRPEGWRLDVRGKTGLAEIRRRVTAAVVGLDFHGETLDLSVAPDQPGEGVGVKLV